MRTLRAWGVGLSSQAIPLSVAAATTAVLVAAGTLAVSQRDVALEVPVPDPAGWFVPVQAASALVWLGASLFTAQRRDLWWWKLAGIAAISHALAALSFAWAVRGLVSEAQAPGANVAAALPAMMLPIEVPILIFMVVSLPAGSLTRVGLDRWGWAACALATAGVLIGTVSEPDAEGTDFASARNPLSIGLAPNVAVPLLMATSAILAVVVLVVRWRRSTGWDRLAMRWVVWIQLFSTIVVVPMIAIAPSGLGVGIAQVMGALGVLAMITVIRRQHLLGVERLLERALLVVLLAASLSAVYVLVVVVGSVFLSDAAGPVAAVAVALAVLPLRDRLDRGVARFVYGDRANSNVIISRIAEAATSSHTPRDLVAQMLDDLRAGTGSSGVSVELDMHGVIASVGDASAPPTHTTFVALHHRGAQIGRLSIAPAEGETCVDPLAEQVAREVAPHVALLADAYRNQIELARAQTRLIRASEEERRRIRRDLHDGLGPILTGAAFSADAASNLVDNDHAEAGRLITATRHDIGTAIGEIRRIVENLRPPALDELGLVGAIRQVAQRFPQLDVAVVDDAKAPDLPAATEVAAYRITTEALTNIARHARATTAIVTINLDADLTVIVTDNGNSDHPWQPGVGLTSMHDRALELGGQLEAGPDPAGGGGRVAVVLPVGAP